MNVQDGDDLSFEALTFGENNENNISHDVDIEESPRGEKDHTLSAEDASKKQKTPPSEGSASIYISTQGDNKIDVRALLRKLEQFGVVKASYFKEKQNFGFVQFLDASAVDAVVDAANRNTLDGMQIVVERANRSGRTSPQSFGATPFSPNTPSVMSGMPFSPAQATPSSSYPTTPSSSLPGASMLPPEKPDTILVLKNLPFALKQDQLQEILMQMNSNAPQSINLHFDNTGVFRGMAFIKYRGLDDAIKVYDSLNGYDVGGRKVRVEYKRKNKGQQPDVPSEWQDEDDLRRLWEQVKDFSTNPNISEISFNSNLSTNQRKQVHAMAEKLKLTHFSNGTGDNDAARSICLKKPAMTPSNSGERIAVPSASANGSAPAAHNGNHFDNARAIDIKGNRRPRKDSDPTGGRTHSPNGYGSMDKSSDPRMRASSFKQKGEQIHHQSDSLDWRTTATSPPVQMGTTPGGGAIPTIVPSRQPKGPDGSKGFNDTYRGARKSSCSAGSLPAPTPTFEIPAQV